MFMPLFLQAIVGSLTCSNYIRGAAFNQVNTVYNIHQSFEDLNLRSIKLTFIYALMFMDK